jgi:SIR2-like domain
MQAMEIPPNLQEQARQGRVVLFLGAGASLASKNSGGKSPPDGRSLARLLSEKFLGGQFNDAPLSTVAEYAVNEQSLFDVQKFIQEIFDSFEPTEAHLQLPQFRWAGLATTNYDLLVEKAYSRVSGTLQKPVAFIQNGDQVIESIRDPKSVMYLKLHGCITRISDENCPLILTTDQYITFRKGRSRIFQQLHEWAYEHTIVFMGHSGQDPDIREIIFEIDLQQTARPRYYLVAPNRSEIEKRFWESKKVTALNGTVADFLSSLDSLLPPAFRSLEIETREPNDISRHFRVSGAILSKNTSEFLAGDALYVSSCTATKQVLPSDFYRGYNADWAAIEQGLDVRRGFADDIIEDVILLSDLQERKPLELVLIKGYAGSGKTVSLRRIAWEAAKSYDCLCVYMDDSAHINVGAIQELIELAKERLFLFVDNAPDRAYDIRNLLNGIGDQGALLTVVIAARLNEWNSVPWDIQSSVTAEYEVPALKHGEVVSLLSLLEKHNALGRLADKKEEARLHAFEGLAGRQLLVALHEATLGKPFEEILESEFRNLVPDEAQRIYLTVCILNRLDVPVRAGIISRVHGIPFSEFKNRLFRPLEHVVYDAYDGRIRDNVYRARHPIIAEIVFERLLQNQDERFQEYYRCLKALNVDYSTDEKAFRQLIRGRTVSELFSNPEHCIAIFQAASEMVGDNPHLLQQMALYEMHRTGGDLASATTYLNRAIEKQPFNKAFKHTKAELALKKADFARTELERDKLLREAASLAVETKDRNFGDTYGHHTLAKVNIKRLENELQSGNNDFSNPELQNIVRIIEEVLSEGLQANPRDSYMLTEQARLAALLKDSPRVIASLEKALEHNSKLHFLAIQLSDCYSGKGDFAKARKVLELALEASRNNRNLNYRFALFLDDHGGSLTEIVYFLRRSFVPGDRNYDAQLRYCRALFLNGEYESARREFQSLSVNKGTPYVPGQRLYGAPEAFYGLVTGIRHTHVLLREINSQQPIFVPRERVSSAAWKHLTEGTKMKFRLAFNFRGPIGYDCELA